MPAMAAKFINSTSAHIFLTGKAGTGKTTFLRGLGDRTHKSFAVVAPTGIAALNAGGVTIHSQFLLPLGTFIPDQNLPDGFTGGENCYSQDTLIRKHPLNSARKQVLRSIELLVIDEVSMLRADILDAVDVRLKAARGNFRQPFGGVQLLLIGDLFQLPPVVKGGESGIMQRYYPTPWFYESKALQQAGFVYIELSKIYRQQDEDFIRILNNLRNNTISPEDIRLLNEHVREEEEIRELRESITLTTHNYKADNMNRDALRRLESEPHLFEASVEGEFPDNIYPVQHTLELKEGAQIMFVRNDTEDHAYFNGKLATVKRISGGKVEVIMAGSNDVYELKKQRWENKRYSVDANSRELSEEVIGTFDQFPVRLAWAITVHKSQGLTFDRAVIDVTQAFADGQVYVALSRLRSLDGLILRGKVNPSVISTDKSIVSFSEQNHHPSKLPDIMKQSRLIFIGQIIDRTFDFEGLIKLIYYIKKTLTDTALKGAPSSGETLDLLVNSLLKEKENTYRYRNQLHGLLAAQNVPGMLERLNKGSAYYHDLLWKDIEILLHHIYSIRDVKRIKSYLNSLEELDQLFTKKLQEVVKIPLLAISILEESEEYSFNTLLKGLEEKRLAFIAKLGGLYAAQKRSPKKRKAKKEKKISTIDITLAMFDAGQSVSEIARERNLVPGTIEEHLFHAMTEGRIAILQLMEEEELNDIMGTAREMPEGFGHTDLYSRLKGKYSYGKLRAAVYHLRTQPQPDSQL